MKRKFLALVLTLVMAATVLTACGEKKDKEVKQSNTEQSNIKQSNTEQSNKEDDSNNTQTETNSNENDDSSAQSDRDKLLSELKERFTLAYYGAADDDSDVYWAVAPDIKSGMFLTVSADKSESTFFIGEIEAVDDEWLNIKDDKSGMEVKVKVEKVDENDPEQGIKLTTEAGRAAALLPMPADQVIDRMFEVSGE